MEGTIYCIKINGEEKKYQKGTPLREIAYDYQKEFDFVIVLVLFNKRVR